MKILIIIQIALSFLFINCIRCNEKLEEINRIVSDSPKKAIELLDSIDRTTLNNEDRYFYDFLCVKANDKAFIQHTSDSLIIPVLHYYEKKKDARYIETLYYAGRVNHDMGDLPTALRFYQESLFHINDDWSQYKDLYGNVLSQIESVLGSLRMYKEQVKYIDRLIELDKLNGDSLFLAEDYQQIGSVMMRQKKYDEAERFYKIAQIYLHPSDTAEIALNNAYLAAISLWKDRPKEALNLIRESVLKTDSLGSSFSLCYAAKIYYENGIYDTAIIHAKKLISRKDLTNKKEGYRILLTDEVQENFLNDTLRKYFSEYKQILEKEFNQNQEYGAVFQNSYYNYSKHDLKRKESEKRTKMLLVWLIIFVFLILFLLMIIFVLKNRRNKTIIELRNALDVIKEIKRKKEDKDNSGDLLLDIDNDSKKLRNHLQEELLSLQKGLKSPYFPSQDLLESEVYAELMKYIEEGRTIGEDNEFWEKLEKTISKIYPHFVKNLRILFCGKLSIQESHTAFLIKCGVSPTDMTVLLGRSKGGISSRRAIMGRKAFDIKMSATVVDDLIRLL